MNVVGGDVGQLRAAARVLVSDVFLECRLAFAAAVSSLWASASLLLASELAATAGAALTAERGWQEMLVRREE